MRRRSVHPLVCLVFVVLGLAFCGRMERMEAQDHMEAMQGENCRACHTHGVPVIREGF